ncbi:MAG: hypothetical protein D6719_05900 [Candidatus Dadabacteria bacterium]|nr:MAG: hypothetical protein D6719_05900 [Candidatus Dadabacteria bacterium]
MRRSVTVQDLHEIAKEVFVDEATRLLKAKKERVNISRLSVLTGIRRKEIKRLQLKEKPVTEPPALLTKVIGKWLHDPAYTTKAGRPRVLAPHNENNGFRALVESISSDVKAGAVLRSLEQIGAIERTTRGIKLRTEAYVPRGDAEEGFKMLALDLNDLSCAVEDNVFNGASPPNLHATTEYDNVIVEDAAELKEWLLKEGLEFHRRLRRKLSEIDRDFNPDLKGSRYRVVVGSFGRIESLDT